MYYYIRMRIFNIYRQKLAHVALDIRVFRFFYYVYTQTVKRTDQVIFIKYYFLISCYNGQTL